VHIAEDRCHLLHRVLPSPVKVLRLMFEGFSVREQGTASEAG
jgi:hypothetical protein